MRIFTLADMLSWEADGLVGESVDGAISLDSPVAVIYLTQSRLQLIQAIFLHVDISHRSLPLDKMMH